MSKTAEFIKIEKDNYGKVFVDISYAMDNVSPFLDAEQIKNRKYFIKLPIIKKYIDLLDAAEAESKKGGFLSLFNSDKYTSLLNDYKNSNREAFNQLKKCSGCACLNCTANCKFDSCLGCRKDSLIKNCDHNKINITFHDSFFLDLNNDRTGLSDKYKVLATLQDCELDRKYIIIKSASQEDKFILYYNPGITEDTYGEITDEDEFDFIASTYEAL
jgi:hypothetical protein